MPMISRPAARVLAALIFALSPLTSRAESPAPVKPSSRPVAAATQPTRPATRAATTRSTATRPVVSTRPTTPLKPLPDDLADLRALQAQVKAVVARVSPAVVGVRVGNGQGSGVIVSEDGYVLTAGHVASAPGRDVTLLLTDGRSVRGKTLGINYEADSGMIKINDPPPGGGKWPVAEWGTSADLKRGQWCITLGHPGGYKAGRTPPLRLGHILEPLSGRFIRTDCTLVGGDSGGPLFDLDGRVIGIHSRIGPSLNDNQHVPVDSFRATWERLASGDAWNMPTNIFARPAGAPYLGVQTEPDAPECRISEVFAKSPAEAAGLKVGDVITRFNRQRVANFGELFLHLGKQKPGDEVAVEVNRDGQTVKVTLTVGKRPANGGRE